MQRDHLLFGSPQRRRHCRQIRPVIATVADPKHHLARSDRLRRDRFGRPRQATSDPVLNPSPPFVARKMLGIEVDRESYKRRNAFQHSGQRGRLHLCA